MNDMKEAGMEERVQILPVTSYMIMRQEYE